MHLICTIAIRAGFMKNLKYCRVGSAYRILPTTSGFCVRTALRKRVVQKSAQESYIWAGKMPTPQEFYLKIVCKL